MKPPDFRMMLSMHPWCKTTGFSLEEFVFGMLELGRPVETLLVGAFYDEGRGAQRDMDLVLHKDGEYNAQLAKDQGDMYVEVPDVAFVGFYCLRGNDDCATLIQEDGSDKVESVVLKTGDVLVLDNRRVKHGRARVGPIGDRLLYRVWITDKLLDEESES